METEYIKIYNLENYILNDVNQRFNENGFIGAFDFFCIIIWKANRAKSKVAKRLLEIDSNLDKCVINLTTEIFNESSDKNKMKILIEKYGFRLPIASTILTMLYPDKFTIYDIRVCETLNDFKGIDNLKFENLWLNYHRFIQEVLNYTSLNVSFRDKDRLLWGKSFHTQLQRDIQVNFKNNFNEKTS